VEPDSFPLQLEVRRAADPIEGCLRSEDGESVPFIGWLELMAAVETARADDDRRANGDRDRPAEG